MSPDLLIWLTDSFSVSSKSVTVLQNDRAACHFVLIGGTRLAMVGSPPTVKKYNATDKKRSTFWLGCSDRFLGKRPGTV
jgi:hypothetical protein